MSAPPCPPLLSLRSPQAPGCLSLCQGRSRGLAGRKEAKSSALGALGAPGRSGAALSAMAALFPSARSLPTLEFFRHPFHLGSFWCHLSHPTAPPGLGIFFYGEVQLLFAGPVHDSSQLFLLVCTNSANAGKAQGSAVCLPALRQQDDASTCWGVGAAPTCPSTQRTHVEVVFRVGQVSALSSPRKRRTEPRPPPGGWAGPGCSVLPPSVCPSRHFICLCQDEETLKSLCY